MNYKDYFPNLSPVEDRLFKEEYWKLGFVAPEKRGLYGQIPIVFNTLKWNALAAYLIYSNGINNMITESMVLEILDNPKREELLKEYSKKLMSEASAKRYKQYKAKLKESNSERDS